MRDVQRVAIDSVSSRLFVVGTSNHRVTPFDVARVTDGENVSNVLSPLSISTLRPVGVCTQQRAAGGSPRCHAPLGGRIPRLK